MVSFITRRVYFGWTDEFNFVQSKLVAQMSLHVSMSFPPQINDVPGYPSWDDDTSALLSIAVSEVILPKDEIDTLCGGEGMHSHLYSILF